MFNPLKGWMNRIKLRLMPVEDEETEDLLPRPTLDEIANNPLRKTHKRIHHTPHNHGTHRHRDDPPR